MRTLMQLAGAAAIAYALLLAGVYLFQSRLIYFPNIAGTNSSNTPARLGFDYEDIRFVTHDGIESKTASSASDKPANHVGFLVTCMM